MSIEGLKPNLQLLLLVADPLWTGEGVNTDLRRSLEAYLLTFRAPVGLQDYSCCFDLKENNMKARQEQQLAQH